MKKTDARREKLNSLATHRRNLAIQKLEADEQKRTDLIKKHLQDKRATFQRFKAKNMFKNASKLASSKQKVIKRFSPSQDLRIFEQVALDFEQPFPEVLNLQPGDMVTVYKKGLGLISHKWCSGEMFGHKGIFPQDILNASDVHNQMYKRSEEIRLKKQILENEKDELKWEKEQANINECTFAPKIKQSTVYITLPVVEDFSREDLSRFQKEFGGQEFVPLIITSGQMVKILKRGLGSSKKWYYGQIYGKTNQKGYFPYRCIDRHGHAHLMHARDRKKAIYRNKLKSEKEDKELQIYSFKPKINKRRQEMYLGKNYKHARMLRENKRRLRQLKDANEELTFQPNIYRPTRAKVNTNIQVVVEDNNRKNIRLYEELFVKSQPKRVEPSHIEHRIKERGHLGLKKAFVTRNFRFSRPGAAAEVLIADFGLKHPVPLELYVGDKVTVLENGVGKNGKWSLGHLGNITGVFPTSCINLSSTNGNKHNDAAYNAVDRKTIKMYHKKKKKLSVSFVETNTKKSSMYRRPKLFNGARKSGMKQQSPKEKFFKKIQSPIKLSKKDPLWPGNIEVFDESHQFQIAKQKCKASTINHPIVLTQKETKKLFALRKRVKEKLEKLPTLHSNTEKALYRSDFTNWLVNNDLIENENRRVVDCFFELIAADEQENISFRDISRSLHDIKIKISKGRGGKREASSWV